ncbi:relaxase/mobilization nuclease domain-containing protein [Listeria booriae]|uniref:relaxase/mobilization nuclease domain-containing protein n=1 Tax=Listeria booriae TaxID=1552123 RepID=UPI0016265993|nr:relaxase/mobilization nuclease domain-containing protein [Listeria booriae]MBC2080285.1 relaxase/mobilization nuclease domain-containing protein [Listeria booriae]
MAVTKIWSIRKTLYLAIKYILNPNKAVYVSSHACAPETADLEFALTLEQNSRSGGTNKAFHIIQSFKPEETSPEQAHEIGKQLLEQHLEGKYEYVLTTHIDKSHIHNHVIFNASSYVDHKKYNDCKKTYYQLRDTSDTLCVEHGLSVIPQNKNKGVTHHEWRMRQEGTSWKQELQKIIDTVIRTTNSYDAFLAKMNLLGYEIKHGKHLAFRAKNQERFTRGKRLGEDYTEEKIKIRIQQKDIILDKRPKKISPTNQPLSIMIELDKNKKAMENKGYEHWAKLHNLKQSAKTINLLHEHEITSLEEWEKTKTNHQEAMSSCTSEIKTVEKELARARAILKQLTLYEDTKKIMSKTPKNKRKTAEYNSTTLLFKTANKALKDFHITPNKQIKEELHQQVQKLQKKQQELYKNHKSLKQTQKQYYIIEQNLRQLLKPTSTKSLDRE